MHTRRAVTAESNVDWAKSILQIEVRKNGKKTNRKEQMKVIDLLRRRIICLTLSIFFGNSPSFHVVDGRYVATNRFDSYIENGDEKKLHPSLSQYGAESTWTEPGEWYVPTKKKHLSGWHAFEHEV